jgi:hypothetical protein
MEMSSDPIKREQQEQHIRDQEEYKDFHENVEILSDEL